MPVIVGMPVFFMTLRKYKAVEDYKTIQGSACRDIDDSFDYHSMRNFVAKYSLIAKWGRIKRNEA